MPSSSFGRFEKVLRIGEGRRLKRLSEQAAYITSLEPDFEPLTDDELLAKTAEFKQRIENGESLDEILYEAFAAVREARKRESGQRLFDVQLMGGIVLHEGDIAEMKTGEGKTFVASAPLYLNALAGDNVHLVTVNDYLAKRDAEWNRPVFDRLGVSVAWIENMMSHTRRKEAYAADITYGTNSEFGFDYLRDNMAVSLDGTVQRGHVFAIVDEVDSILIDEARTPLIISGEPETAAKTYYDFARVVRELEGAPLTRKVMKGEDETELSGADYLYDEKFKTVSPAQTALDKVERALGVDNLYDPRNVQLVNHLTQALKARVALQARRRLRRAGRRGQDRRRVHRPDHGGTPLERGAPPGDRGEGGRRDPRGERHARDDHAPELLPPLREARRHDGHGEDGGEGVRRDLQPARRRDPDQRPRRARRRERLHLQVEGREVERGARGHRRAPRARSARARRHDRGRDVRVPLGAPQAARHPAQRAEREGARARERDHRRRRSARRRDDRDEHGRPRRRHQARRGRRRGRRALRARHRAARVPPHRQPAPRPLGTPGRSGRDALLPLRPGRPRPPVRRRPDPRDHGALQDPGRPADGGVDPLAPDRERAEEGRGAELRLAQERPQVRRRDEHAAHGHLRAAARRARGR